MSYAVTPTYGASKLTRSINEVQAGIGLITLNFGIIFAPGAAFVTNGTVPGDGAVITGSGVGNNGTHIIVAVLSNSAVLVADGLVDESGAGSVEVLAGEHVLTITNEATTSWDTIHSTLANEGYVMRRTARGSLRAWDVFAHTFATINVVHSGATATAWTSESEVVYSRQSSTAGAWELSIAAADPGTLSLTLGNLASGSDRRSYRQGSVWLGVKWPDDASGGNSAKWTLAAHSSLLSQGEDNQRVALGKDGILFGCLVEGDVFIPNLSSGGGAELQDVLIVAPDEAIRAGYLVDHSDNVVVASSADDGLLQSGGAVVLQGLSVGDAAFSPAFTINTKDVDFRDLETDVAPTDLFAVSTDGIARISYTWTPRVVELAAPTNSGGAAIPVSGAQVRASLIEVERAAFLSFGDSTPNPGLYTVTINGTAFSRSTLGGETRQTIAQAIVTAINAGAEPVSATLQIDGNERGVRVVPDDPEVAFTFAVSSTGSAWSVRNHIVAVSGSPWTTDSNGLIGDVVIEAHLHSASGGDKGAFNRQLLIEVTKEGHGHILVQRVLTKRLREDIFLTPWTPRRQRAEMGP